MTVKYKETFENYDADFNNHHKQLKLIHAFGKSEFKQLLIFGKSGRGKTHLVKAMVERAGSFDIGLKRTPKIKMIMALEFYYTILKSAYGMGVNDFFCCEYDFDDLVKSKAIIIDDLGKEKIENENKNNFSNGFQLLLDKYQGKLIITTNLNREAVYDRYGEFIGNRLFDKNITQTIVLDGKDYRQHKAGEKK